LISCAQLDGEARIDETDSKRHAWVVRRHDEYIAWVQVCMHEVVTKHHREERLEAAASELAISRDPEPELSHLRPEIAAMSLEHLRERRAADETLDEHRSRDETFVEKRSRELDGAAAFGAKVGAEASQIRRLPSQVELGRHERCELVCRVR
jgi:hypothetical protein